MFDQYYFRDLELGRIGCPLLKKNFEDDFETFYNCQTVVCSIGSKQEINISRWLIHKDEEASIYFPFEIPFINDQSSSKSKNCEHFLIALDFSLYRKDTLEHCIKIQDYGVLKAWEINNTSLNLLLESDINHIVNLGTMFLQGRYFINNCLFINRILSVAVKGKPCVYHLIKKSTKTQIWNKENLIRNLHDLDNAAKIADVGYPIAIESLNVKVYLQNDTPENFEKVSLEKKIQQEIDELPFTLTPPNKGRSVEVVLSKNEEFSEDVNKKEDEIIIKPPNVLIYTESAQAGKNIKAVLSKILDPERYIISYLIEKEAPRNTWIDQVALVVVCGNVKRIVTNRFMEYILRGGKLLSLCSNMLRTVLPSFNTTEMCENKLTAFSYGNWEHVRLIHSICCYQASPKRNFSEDDEDEKRSNSKSSAPSKQLQQFKYIDEYHKEYSFQVEILCEEQTWQNPSILLATTSNGGKIVFCQIHLETDPMDYEDQKEFETLKENDHARLEIISDLLNRHLEMEINRATKLSTKYTPAYLITKPEYKIPQELLNLMKDKLKMSDLEIQFCTDEENFRKASENFLPIIRNNEPPSNFLPKRYYKALKTKKLGQLVIYSDVLKCTMNVVENRMTHGLAVISRQQTQGRGRSSNTWLSPVGCAMFTLQVHIPKVSNLGGQISILQSIVAVAMISAVRSLPGYEEINLRIKWPNDIYVGKSTKIGGLIVHTLSDASDYICNIGAGINISNSKPTTCINDVILLYNNKYKKNLKKFTYEEYLALVFNELEKLLDCVEKNNIGYFYNSYYKYWLHKNEEVTVLEPTGEFQKATIIRIDDFGFLVVHVNINGLNTELTVHPDRNTFNLLKGLIFAK